MTSEGGTEPVLRVDHDEPGERFEHATVRCGSHGVQVWSTEEGIRIYVHDHLHVEIVGEHKDEPAVVVDSDEFPTGLIVRDTERSFDRDPDGVGPSIDRADE